MPVPIIVGGAIGAYRAYKAYKAIKKAKQLAEAAKKAKQIADAAAKAKQAADAAAKAKQAADAAAKAKKAADAAKKAKKTFSDTKKGACQNCTKKQLKVLRNKAVRQAWSKERERVRRTGRGSRNWSEPEKKELLETGKVKGYQGHHKKPVAQYPKHAGDPKNIEFLTYPEHLAKHGKKPRIPTK